MAISINPITYLMGNSLQNYTDLTVGKSILDGYDSTVQEMKDFFKAPQILKASFTDLDNKEGLGNDQYEFIYNNLIKEGVLIQVDDTGADLDDIDRLDAFVLTPEQAVNVRNILEAEHGFQAEDGTFLSEEDFNDKVDRKVLIIQSQISIYKSSIKTQEKGDHKRKKEKKESEREAKIEDARSHAEHENQRKKAEALLEQQALKMIQKKTNKKK